MCKLPDLVAKPVPICSGALSKMRCLLKPATACQRSHHSFHKWESPIALTFQVW